MYGLVIGVQLIPILYPTCIQAKHTRLKLNTIQSERKTVVQRRTDRANLSVNMMSLLSVGLHGAGFAMLSIQQMFGDNLRQSTSMFTPTYPSMHREMRVNFA